MKILLFFIIIFISIFIVIFSENESEKREIIRVKISIGATNYYRYIQLSNFSYPNSFTIIKRDE